MRVISFNKNMAIPTYDRGTVNIKKGEPYVFNEKYAKEIRMIYDQNSLIERDEDFSKYHKPYRGGNLSGKKIFCFRTSGIGDLLAMFLPIRLLKQKYKDLEVVAGSSLGYKELFESNPDINEFVVVPYPLKYIEEADYTFYFQGLIESNEEAKHINMYDLFLRSFGFDYTQISVEDKKPEVYIDPTIKSEVVGVLGKSGVPKKQIVGVQLNTSSIIRNYPDMYYRDLIARLDALGLSVVLIGDQNARQVVMNQSLDSIGDVFDFTPYSKSLQHFFSVISLCDFIISPDTSSLHIAGALKKPMIGMFGPIRSDLRIKYFDNAIGIDCEMPCSPCFRHMNKPCRNSHQNGNSYCMHITKPDMIIDVVKNKMLPLFGVTQYKTQTQGAWRAISDQKRAIVTLAIGEQATAELEIAKPSLELYARKTGSDLVVLDEKKINFRNNKFEKFQISQLLEKYDRVLYVDSDIVIHPNCDDLFEMVPEDHIGAVPDSTDGKWGNINRYEEIANSQNVLGDVGWRTGYFNSGVLVLSKIHRGIFDDPENRTKINSQFGDQTILNYNVFKHRYNIFPLNKIYNGMEITGFSSRTEPQNKTDAMIMHFANEGNKVQQMKKIVNMFKEFKNDILYYDCGELGWSLYLVAHLKYLTKNMSNLTVCTYEERFCLYNTLPVKLIPIPEEISQKLKGLTGDGNHLFDPKENKRVKHDVLGKIFSDYFTDYNVVTEYNTFQDKREFFKFVPTNVGIESMSEIIGKKDIILVFPRYRDSKFSERNLPKEFYIDLCNRLCREYYNYNIVAVGSLNSSYLLDDNIKHDNFIDLTLWEDRTTLDILIAMCSFNRAKFAIGSQSSLPKISLLCGVPTFIIGHQKTRHTSTENWMNTKVGFYQVSKDKYGDFNFNNCMNKIFKFIEIPKPIKIDEISEDDKKEFYDEKYDKPYILEYSHGMPIVFYDCGEIGWTPYIVARIKKFKEESIENAWRRVIVSTSKAKRVFYHDCCDEIVDVPEELLSMVKAKGYEPERNMFVSPKAINPSEDGLIIDSQIINSIYKRTFPGCEIFSGRDRITDVENKYFRPYIASNEAKSIAKDMCGSKSAFLIFPRNRMGKFGNRNLSRDLYINVANCLLEEFKRGLVISIGSRSGAYHLNNYIDNDGFIDLVDYEDDKTLDLLVAFSNLDNTAMAFGSQSGLPKVSLLCGVPTYIIGHQMRRHVIDENWAGTKVKFKELNVSSQDKYHLSTRDESIVINEIIDFAKEVRP